MTTREADALYIWKSQYVIIGEYLNRLYQLGNTLTARVDGWAKSVGIDWTNAGTNTYIASTDIINRDSTKNLRRRLATLTDAAERLGVYVSDMEGECALSSTVRPLINPVIMAMEEVAGDVLSLVEEDNSSKSKDTYIQHMSVLRDDIKYTVRQLTKLTCFNLQSFQAEVSGKYLIDVITSCGSIAMDIDGNIESITWDDDPETKPVKFDVMEWIMYHRCHILPKRIDILDLGYTNANGDYSHADLQWRLNTVMDELRARDDEPKSTKPGVRVP